MGVNEAGRKTSCAFSLFHFSFGLADLVHALLPHVQHTLHPEDASQGVLEMSDSVGIIANDGGSNSLVRARFLTIAGNTWFVGMHAAGKNKEDHTKQTSRQTEPRCPDRLF